MDQGQAKAFVDPFVKRNWRALAAAAWQGYRSRGRGALRIDWATVRRWIEGEPMASAPAYVTELDVTEATPLLQQYDPEASAVILFRRDDGTVNAWIFRDSPVPPKAHDINAH